MPGDSVKSKGPEYGPQEITALARRAVAVALAPLDFEPTVVVNIAWEKGGKSLAISTAVPPHCNATLADSLRESADEADDAFKGSGC
jgi:hypothetical protein